VGPGSQARKWLLTPDDGNFSRESTSKVELPPVRGAGYEPSAPSGEPTGVAHCLEVCTSAAVLYKSFDKFAAKQSMSILSPSTSTSPNITPPSTATTPRAFPFRHRVLASQRSTALSQSTSSPTPHYWRRPYYASQPVPNQHVLHKRPSSMASEGSYVLAKSKSSARLTTEQSLDNQARGSPPGQIDCPVLSLLEVSLA
jgi:hypothetical protein